MNEQHILKLIACTTIHRRAAIDSSLIHAKAVLPLDKPGSFVVNTDIHRSRKIDLPKPEFYVIYTGREEGMLKTLFGLVQEGLLGVSIAAKKAGMKEDAFRTLMNQTETGEDKE